MTTATQADFARLIGVARSYVTALKNAGRLVMTADGRVEVEDSISRIDATKDPNRDDVAARHAQAREAFAPTAPPPSTAPAQVREAEDHDISYQDARTIKERYAAKTAKLEYERAAGLMIERAAVAAAVEDLLTALRQSLEQQPHRLAPLLLGQDLDVLRSTLRQETETMLSEMVRDFATRLRQLAGEEESA